MANTNTTHGRKRQNDLTVDDAIRNFLASIRLARSENTANSYKNALRVFKLVMTGHRLYPEHTPISSITEDWVAQFATYLKNYSPATESLYIQAVAGFYKYLAAENLVEVNLPRLELLIKQRTRKPGIRLPQFPVEDIEKILERAGDSSFRSRNTEEHGISTSAQNEINQRLREIRDKAFLITLADTGLRVHEACKLRRGDLDWNEGRALIIGKGNKQAVVRFSTRAMQALREYLSIRSNLDGSSGRPLTALPLFARHDKGAGKKIKAMTPTTGRNIVNEWVKKILGEKAVGKITPHSFRHYFVTTVLRGSGNLKLAQELARHSNIQVTQRYAHINNDELDKGYYDIFEKQDKEK